MLNPDTRDVTTHLRSIRHRPQREQAEAPGGKSFSLERGRCGDDGRRERFQRTGKRNGEKIRHSNMCRRRQTPESLLGIDPRNCRPREIASIGKSPHPSGFPSLPAWRPADIRGVSLEMERREKDILEEEKGKGREALRGRKA